MKKRLLIIASSLIIGYYVIGFPLTLLGIAKEWPLFPGGLTLKYEGENRSIYENDTVQIDNDGPYVFYKGDSLEMVHIAIKDSVQLPAFSSFHKKENARVPIDCHFKNNPEWNFTTYLRDTLVDEPTNYSEVKRILVISDIEGNFKAFREFMISHGVMDSLYRWTFSDGHLVLLGDFFDRGLHVTECLWLIYHLESEAKIKGGYVHFVLGNHEIMNMTDDFRYVRKKYINNADLIGRAYDEYYKPNSELGKWLSTKNVVEQIDKTIFVHGGISEAVLSMGLGLEEINTLSRPFYFTSRKMLPEGNVNVKNLFNTEDSPFWNRDYVNQEVDESFIGRVLSTYKANEIVVGHTIVDNVKTFYSNKVIAVDTKHTNTNSFGLLIDNGEYFSIDRRGVKNRIK